MLSDLAIHCITSAGSEHVSRQTGSGRLRTDLESLAAVFQQSTVEVPRSDTEAPVNPAQEVFV